MPDACSDVEMLLMEVLSDVQWKDLDTPSDNGLHDKLLRGKGNAAASRTKVCRSSMKMDGCLYLV